MHFVGSLLLPLLLSTSTWAHGHVMTITIAGKAYSGNVPNGPKGPSVIRQISTPFPNHGAHNVALTCGPDSTPGTLIADANPGDEVTFDWKGGDLGLWPHNIGPMFTYMASCGSITCDKFNISEAKWFKPRKLAESQTMQMEHGSKTTSGGVAVSQIPSTLSPGNYLIRHEIIALHLADQGPKKAEFYPSCSQLRISGNQTGVPQESDLVSIPGAYNDTDPGLNDPNVFNIDIPYVFPGPPVVTLVNGTTGSGSTVSSTVYSSTNILSAASKATTGFATGTPSAGTLTTGRMVTVTVTVNAATMTASTSPSASTDAISSTGLNEKRALLFNIKKRHSHISSRVMRGMN